ncbi:MAG: hypothetical protein Q8N28_02200 [bacterium]|nr:hypothetical protein [bacterium]
MDYIKIYANFLKKFLKPQCKLKVVFDCSNGTAGIILKNLKTEKLKAILINQKPDGNFPAHGPNPLMPDALKQIQKAVIKHKADFGAIFDADADRVFFIDNFGRFVNPDIIARLLIWHLKPKKVIIDIRTGWQVKKSKVKSQKLKVVVSRVGHYFIKKLMRKIKADFAAEYSGHYYFKKFFYADSGILAAIEAINAVSKLPHKLSDFIDLLPQYYRSSELNLKFNSARNYAEHDTELRRMMRKIEQKFKKQVIKISHLDGLTMEFEEWWFNLRPSNTEPLIRLSVEAASKNLLNQKTKELQKLLV